MQFQPSYIDVSDLVMTEFRNWYELSQAEQLAQGGQDSASSCFPISASSISSPIDYYDFPYEDYHSGSEQDEDLDDMDSELCLLSQYQDQYSWAEELNEYGDVINKLLVHKKNSKPKNEQEQSTQQDDSSQKNQFSQDPERFSEPNVSQDLLWIHCSKLGAVAWWQQNRKDKVARYLKKKERRYLGKKFSYNCRKTVASIRLRIKGKFIGKSQAQKILNEDLNNMSNDQIKERLNHYYKAK